MADTAPTLSAKLLEVRGLTRTFTSRNGLFGRKRVMTAVADVSLDVPRGQVTGVVGESGCGKSTLARLVLRLLEADQGQVLFEGVDLASLSASAMRRLRRRLQFVFQDPYSSIDPRYTIRAALLEPSQVQGEHLHAAAATDRINSLMAMVGLNPSLAQSYPHQLSGGQKQRIGIARALALQPSFLVLDEPTASLDVSIQAQIIALLEKLQQELGLTYLFISHDLGLVRYFCDRIVVMYLGRIVEVLPSADTPPRHPYTIALMESTFEPDPAKRRVITRLNGELPDAFNPPPGCAYAARCAHASDRCRSERPALVLRDGHELACHHPPT
ncbi:ABC transporter ATP-binding protein [Rhodoferax fermentans]|uniref:ABC transporter ATP-binding protein n=1 Tax=Rhodoferax fermentans TaxID=28066 RepID=UPI0019032147|nr:oligopeptide/dipeptide ABC transporter ATP-binding protein [Rhodoferax fermentans]